MSVEVHAGKLGPGPIQHGWAVFANRPRLLSLKSNMSQDILVGSFSTHLQVLHFDVNRGTLELSQVSEPAFDKYTWIAASPKLPGVFYGAGRTPSDGVLTAFKISAAQDSTSDRYKVQILSNCSSGGQDPAHIGVRNDGARVGIANVSCFDYPCHHPLDDNIRSPSTTRARSRCPKSTPLMAVSMLKPTRCLTSSNISQR